MNSPVEKEKLSSFVERIERLLETKAEIASDIKDIYGEAKSQGYDIKALKSLIKARKQDPKKREEEEEMLTLYMSIIGMLKSN
jgi:uncharacterized protein (UPF0335 family)